jgi:hypothetical protein
LRGFFDLNRHSSRLEEHVMTNERKHGNREAKKPKAVKAAVAAIPPKMDLGSLSPIKPPKKGSR